MTLRELMEIQRMFDERHGWKIASNDDERLSWISRDIIGLLGEVGEFANQIKKIQLLDHDSVAVTREFRKRHSQLSEELVDTLIYLVRLAGHLDADLEKSYLEKLEWNKKKYAKFEGKD
jgi:NTP pyrophosphatase (non-canonical NTP hydrolase)